LSRANKKKKKGEMVSSLDASDLQCIEEMKKNFAYVGRPSVKPSLITGCVWVADRVEMSGFDELNELNRCLFWYNLFSKYFDEEFSI